MGQVKVETVTVRKKEPVSKPQPKIEARRVVVNNQVKKLHTAAAKVSKTSSSTPVKQTTKATSRSTTRASSKRAVKRLAQANKQSKNK